MKVFQEKKNIGILFFIWTPEKIEYFGCLSSRDFGRMYLCCKQTIYITNRIHIQSRVLFKLFQREFQNYYYLISSRDSQRIPPEKKTPRANNTIAGNTNSFPFFSSDCFSKDLKKKKNIYINDLIDMKHFIFVKHDKSCFIQNTRKLIDAY